MTPFFQSLWQHNQLMLDGLLVTISLVTLSILIGAILALPLSFARLSSIRSLRAFSFSYSYFFRATPILAQIFFVYYGIAQFRQELQGIGLWYFFRDAFFCAVLTFSLNSAAYLSEIFTRSIKEVPHSQIEAAQALGLGSTVIFLKIILPQALLHAFRPIGNEIILLIKASAIASMITIFDLMGVTRRIYSESFEFSIFIWAAIFYLIITETIRRLWEKIEDALTRHLPPPRLPR